MILKGGVTRGVMCVPWLLLILVALVTPVVESRDNCQQRLQQDEEAGLLHDVTHDLMFLPTPISDSITCVHQHQELTCCAHNFQFLRWYHYDNTSSHTWEEVKLSSHVYHSTEGDNRTLVLERPVLSDGGWYRCTAEDGMGHKISHNITLYIEGCPGPIHSAPVMSLVPEGVLLRQLGVEVNLTCNGYFGPHYEDDLLLWLQWTRVTTWENGSGTEVDNWVPQYSQYPQYMPQDPRLQLTLSMESDTQTSVLTINNLSLADYGNYTCFAWNSNGVSEMNTVTLLQGDPNSHPSREQEEPDPLGPVVASVLGGIISAVVCVTVLGLIFHKDIQLMYRDNFAKPRNPDAQYDALMIYNEVHSPDCLFVVKTLLPVLEEKYGYQLCIAERDFIAGPDLGDVIVDNIEASQAIVFVVTEAMLQQEWCDFVFQYVAAREYTNLVFIMCGAIGDQAWHTNQAPLKKVIDTSKNVITWPEDPRKKDNFWKELRLTLPAKLGKVQDPDPLSDTDTDTLFV